MELVGGLLDFTKLMLITTQFKVYLKLELSLAIAQLIVHLTSYDLSRMYYNGFSSLFLVVCFNPEVIPYFSGDWVVGWVAGEMENIAI